MTEFTTIPIPDGERGRPNSQNKPIIDALMALPEGMALSMAFDPKARSKLVQGAIGQWMRRHGHILRTRRVDNDMMAVWLAKDEVGK